MRTTAILAAAAATLALAGCSSDASGASPPASSQASPAATPGTDDTYVVEGYAFEPLTASPGQVVQVTNADDEPHTLTAEGGEFDTGSFDQTDPGTFTAPDRPGTYRFVCRIHPSMEGTLTVR